MNPPVPKRRRFYPRKTTRTYGALFESLRARVRALSRPFTLEDLRDLHPGGNLTACLSYLIREGEVVVLRKTRRLSYQPPRFTPALYAPHPHPALRVHFHPISSFRLCLAPRQTHAAILGSTGVSPVTEGVSPSPLPNTLQGDLDQLLTFERFAVMLDTVCRHFWITRDELFSRLRTSEVADARQVLIALVLPYARNYSAAARFFRKHPGTIRHALKAVAAKRATDPTFRARLEAIHATLQPSFAA